MKGSTQLKVQIKRWAEESGLWKQFVDIRERMKKDGIPPQQAWVDAAAELDPEKWGSGGGPMGPELDDLPRGRSEEEVPTLPMVEVLPEEVSKPSGRGSGGERAVKSVFSGKKVATVKVVEWVASNMQVEDVVPSDAPSSEAWGMLVWARRSPINESQFWGSIYAKLLPSRSAVEAEQRYGEDGGKIEETAERLLSMRVGLESKKEA